jgi:dienelactone hydrolase
MSKAAFVLISAIFLLGSIRMPKPGTGQTAVLRVSPDPSLADEPVRIVVSGLKPGQAVVVKATMVESQPGVWGGAAGGQRRTWTSSVEFSADGEGVVDLGRLAPERGSYAGVDAMGLFWSMQNTKTEPIGCPADLLAPVSVKFEVEAAGTKIAETSVMRLFVAPGVKREEVRANGLVGVFFKPADGKPPGLRPAPGILVLGGSEGGLKSAELRGALLASHGYAALALAYFRAEGLPQQLAAIPLEYLKKAIDWLGANPSVDHSRLAVLGSSKGGELALLLGSRFPELKAVVAYVPSHVVWQAIGPGSSWTYEGRPLPFVPYKAGAGGYDPNDWSKPVNLRELYEGSLDNGPAVAAAAIPVERNNGPVLVISGKDDQVWPSSLMAEAVMRRLKEHKHRYGDAHLDYESAGHGIRSYYWPTTRPKEPGAFPLGGTAEGDARAQADSWPKVLKFIDKSLRSGLART